MPTQGLYGWPNQGSLNRLLGFPGQDVARKSPTPVQYVGANTGLSDTSESVSFANLPTLRNVIVVLQGCHNGSGPMPAPSGGGVTTWSLAKRTVGNFCDAEIWVGLVDTTPNKTITISGLSDGYMRFVIAEWVLPSGGKVGNTAGTTAASSPNTISAIAFGLDEVAFWYMYGETGSASLPSGFTDMSGGLEADARAGYQIARGQSIGASATTGSKSSSCLVGIS